MQHLCFLDPPHRKDTECGIAASVLHAEVALTSALPLQLELKKVTLNQGVCRYCIPKEPTASTAETSATKADKAIVLELWLQSWSCNVAGFSLGVVAVVASMFELGKVRTQALCPSGKKVSFSAPTGMLKFLSSSSRESHG